VAAMDAEGVDEEASTELKDTFMSTWGEKPIEGEISLLHIKGMYGLAELTRTQLEDFGLVQLTEEEKEERAERQRVADEEAARQRAIDDEQARLDSLVALYREGVEEHQKIKQANKSLQELVIARLLQLKRTDAPRPMDGGREEGFSDKTMQDHQQTYDKILSVIDDLRLELRTTQEEMKDKTSHLKDKRDVKDSEASALETEFLDFKREVAKGAENSRTGKAIPAKLIAHLEQLEAEKEMEVEKARLKNISHRTTLKKLEHTLKRKEELAKGLPLIDFEQLKIENQTLNERIEERNEELLKLRKKTTSTVQVLTHVKEKLQYVQQEVSVQKEKLAAQEEDVSHHRDLLTHLKHERDRLRADNQRLKQQGGMMASDAILEDFEQREEETNLLNDKLALLKKQHATYTNVILAANNAQVGGMMQ